MGVAFPGESAEYRAARDRLLEQEVALRRATEAVAASRRQLPMGGEVPQDYVFQGARPDGSVGDVRLSELFAPGRDSLAVYNFMFPRHPTDYQPGPSTGNSRRLPLLDSPCPSCTSLLDQLDGAMPHLKPLMNFAVVAKAPIDRVLDFASDRGWRHLRLLSASDNTFKREYLAESETGEQLPLLNVFHRDGDTIHHFWSSELLFEPPDPGQDPRHVGTVESVWNFLDFTPEGRAPSWVTAAK
jgi:predicted dithiol-disulfide oxidoreductase (DUF899 family)